MVASQSNYPMVLTQIFLPGRPLIKVDATAKTVVMMPTTITVLLMCVVIKTNTALWKVVRHQLTRRATRISINVSTTLITTKGAS